MAPIINIFKREKKTFITKVLVTAQHREMLDQVLNLFNIQPDFDLNLMSSNQSLNNLTRKILSNTTRVLNKFNPDIIFVQGDTTSTFSAALAGFYEKIPILHIEAGLRTGNMYSPFPEEINRKMTSALATYHFAPTNLAAQNLINEGINTNRIITTGNTVIDAFLSISKEIDKNISNYYNYFKNNYDIEFESKKTILVTGHRRESFGKKFEVICNAIK